MTSEVNADVSGTISPQTQVFQSPVQGCLLCQPFLEPGSQAAHIRITEGNADSWAPPRPTESESLGLEAGDLHGF